ncbi:hypothetical protein TIFTF001_046121 [Ficus carica]|uniref:Uncharacterized protein n=1 Tax=Ficus carica TaxID=3494 RepID=A0AA88CMF8_FICCA|nr:hypothetical protein TIFTF001_046121 [Ficus carica]
MNQIAPAPDILEIQELSPPNTNLSPSSNSSTFRWVEVLPIDLLLRTRIDPLFAPDILEIQEQIIHGTLRWVNALPINILLRTRIDLIPAPDILDTQVHIVYGVQIGPAPDILEIQELSPPNTNLSPSSDSSVGGGVSNRPSASNSNRHSSCTRYPGDSKVYRLSLSKLA